MERSGDEKEIAGGTGSEAVVHSISDAAAAQAARASPKPDGSKAVWLIAIGCLALGAAGIYWWQSRAQKTQYVTAPVTRGNIQRTVSMTGALNPVVTVQVGSYVSGTIKSLGCDYNTEVVVGQVCAVIDPVPFQLIVDQDKAVLGTGIAQLKKDEAALTYAKLALARDTKLLAESSVSQDTVDSDQSTYDQAAAQVGLDKASNVDKEAILKAAQVNLAYTNIVSPVIGTVITRAIDVGQTVAASLASPTLFLIGKDLTQMQVDTNVSEADVGEVRLGQDAWFSVQAFAGKTFRGKVTQVRRGPITVQNVVTYDVVIAVPNPDRALFPGMTADTHIVIDEHNDVMRVPLPAVRFNPEGVGHAREKEGAGEAKRDRRSEVLDEAAVDATGAQQPAQRGDGAQANDDGSERANRKREHAAGNGEKREHNRADWAERKRQRAEGATASADGDGADERKGGHRDHEGKREAGGEHRAQVWVLTDGVLHAVRVTTGLDDGAMVEVSSDELKPGDNVVVNEAGGEHRATAAPPQGQAFRQGGQGGPRL